jgi:hypothetical protein
MSWLNLFHMFTNLFLKEDSTFHCHRKENSKFHSVILILSPYSLQKLCNVGPNFEKEHKLQMTDNKFAQESMWT